GEVISGPVAFPAHPECPTQKIDPSDKASISVEDVDLGLGLGEPVLGKTQTTPGFGHALTGAIRQPYRGSSPPYPGSAGRSVESIAERDLGDDPRIQSGVRDSDTRLPATGARDVDDCPVGGGHGHAVDSDDLVRCQGHKSCRVRRVERDRCAWP